MVFLLCVFCGDLLNLLTWGKPCHMCSDMNHQVLRPRESLVTLGAEVLLLPIVSLNMATQVSFLGKNLFTLRAGVGCLACVDSNVFFQVSRL